MDYNLKKMIVLLIVCVSFVSCSFAELDIVWYDNCSFSSEPMYGYAGTFLVYNNRYTSEMGTWSSMETYLDNAEDMNKEVIIGVNQGTISLPSTVDPDNPTGTDVNNLISYINKFKNHNALAGWYIADEPDMQNIPVNCCEASYNLVKARSSLPCYIAFSGPVEIPTTAPSDYADAYDVLMGHSYPYGDNVAENAGNGNLKTNFDDIKDAASDVSKDFRLTILAHGELNNDTWHKRLPTKREFEFAIWYGLAVGDTPVGFSFYAKHWMERSVANSSDPYPDDGYDWYDDVFNPVIEEVDTLRYALDYKYSTLLSNSSVLKGSVFQCPYTDKYYVVVVNTANFSVTNWVQFKQDSGSNIPGTWTKVKCLTDNEEFTVSWNNAFSPTLANYEAKVYEIIGDDNPEKTGYYEVKNRNSLKLLRPLSGSTTVGADISQYHDSNYNSQDWEFIVAGEGAYKIKNRNSGYYVRVDNDSLVDATKLIQTDTTNDFALWRVVDLPGGYIKIVNKGSHMVMRPAMGSTSDNAQVKQYYWRDYTSQQWTLQR
ncbi:MAG: RICIN domain-containing protein [Sedimentisphaeraceae bacterium JB056]